MRLETKASVINISLVSDMQNRVTVRALERNYDNFKYGTIYHARQLS